MVKRDTAYWIAFAWYLVGGAFGSSIMVTIISSVIFTVVFGLFETKVNFTDDNTESGKDDKGEKE